MELRPTLESVRQSLFNILGSQRLQGAKVADLFAGTGALGLEALSRGAQRLVLVEKDRRALRVLRRNVAILEATEQVTVIPMDLLARKAVERLKERLDAAAVPFDLVLADPPWRFLDASRRSGAVGPEALPAALAEAGLLAAGALVVLEHGVAQPPRLPPHERLVEWDRRCYGETGLVILEHRC
jgi:16S rRNA (guanine966-N2)-methyltransferase